MPDLNTERDHYAHLIPGGGYNILNQMHRTRLHDAAVAGLDAMIVLYFDEYSDEILIPRGLHDLADFLAEHFGLSSELYDEAMCDEDIDITY